MKIVKRSLNEEALSENDHMDSFSIIVTDKKRGTFFVAVVKPKKARFINK